MRTMRRDLMEKRIEKTRKSWKKLEKCASIDGYTCVRESLDTSLMRSMLKPGAIRTMCNTSLSFEDRLSSPHT